MFLFAFILFLDKIYKTYIETASDIKNKKKYFRLELFKINNDC